MKLFNKKYQAFRFTHKEHEIIILNSIKGHRLYIDGEEYNCVTHDSMTFCDARINVETDEIYICLWSGMADVNIMAVTGDVIHFTSDEKNGEFNADFNGHKLLITEKALGERRIYLDGETDTQAKSLIELEQGDTIDFLCDYYTYDGSYENSYYLGDPMTVTENMEISNVSVGAPVSVCFRFTDLYQQHYWTPVLVSG